jgi:hypothetical protein
LSSWPTPRPSRPPFYSTTHSIWLLPHSYCSAGRLPVASTAASRIQPARSRSLIPLFFGRSYLHDIWGRCCWRHRPARALARRRWRCHHNISHRVALLRYKRSETGIGHGVGLYARRSWPFGGHGPCRIQPSTMCDDRETLADCGPYKVAPDNIWPCTISNVSYFLEKERVLKDSRPRKKKRLVRIKVGELGRQPKLMAFQEIIRI